MLTHWSLSCTNPSIWYHRIISCNPLEKQLQSHCWKLDNKWEMSHHDSFVLQHILTVHFSQTDSLTVNIIMIIIMGRNGIYFMWVAASYRGEARGLWINASPRERSLVKYHLGEFRIWKGFLPWGNRGSVACHLLRMKTSATYPQPQVASQHLDGTWTRRPSPLPTAMLVWYGEQPRGITPLAESRRQIQDLVCGKPVTYH